MTDIVSSHDKARERIIDAAGRLFRRHGYQAVSVDTIVEVADVAKMTLYRHFGSKDDLIVEFLLREDAAIREWVQSITVGTEDPEEAISALFDALEDRIFDPGCAGCVFQMALGEFSERQHPAHIEAVRHMTMLRTFLDRWVWATDLDEPDVTSERLFMLMQGAWAACRVGVNRPAGLAEAATLLLAGERYAQSLAEASRTKKD